jgi:16S rRNA (guanine(966)-N(2))-methyltransferase RsmD
LRPTSDRTRETLFNILAPRMMGANVLDLYAGTGAVGIEAISRGALQVAFVEQDPRAQALIADNLEHCGVLSGYAILGTDTRRALKRFARVAQGQPMAAFDVIVADPPYATDMNDITRVVSAAGECLASGGVLVLEHSRRAAVPEKAGRLVRSRVVRSGDTALSFYEGA